MPHVSLLRALCALCCGLWSPWSQAATCQSKAVLKVGLLQKPASLNPVVALTPSAHQITELVFERLVEWGAHTKKPKPILARSWKLYGNTSILVHLRKGIRWHDGRPFTAKDVAFTIGAKSKAGHKIKQINLARVISHTKIWGPHKLQIYFVSNQTGLPNLWHFLTFKVLPRHRYGRRPTSVKLAQRGALIGTGPFRLSRLSPKRWLFRRHGKYWRKGYPCLGGVAFHFAKGLELARSFAAGKLDVVYGLQGPAARRVQQVKGARLRSYTLPFRWPALAAFGPKVKRFFFHKRHLFLSIHRWLKR